MRTVAWVTCGCLVSTVSAAQVKFWSPLVPPRAQYTVTVKYSASDQKLEGTETIRFRNETQRSIGRIALNWFGDIAQVRANGMPATTPAGKFAVPIFDLPNEVAPGKEIELTVDYSAAWKLGARTSSAITSFLNPRLSWGVQTQDDYVVRISLPDGYAVATSGRFDQATGAYVARNVRAFGLFVGKSYETAEADAGDVRVRAVFTPQGRTCAELLLKTAVDAVGYYRQRFGFYPQSSLSIVPGGEEPHGGYPAATGLVVVHGQERMQDREEPFWRWITAHEIGHQYWMEHVLADGDDPLPWLLIGLGIHADREYRKARGITSAGLLRSAYAEGIRKGYDTTIDRTDEQRSEIDWDSNNVVDHGKSAALVDALESVIGADAFDAVYRRILREYAGKRLGWRDFQHLSEVESGQNLEWFFQEWVRSSKSANYRVGARQCSKSTGGFACTVQIERGGAMRMPVTVAARFEDGSEQLAITERLADVEELTFRSAAPLKEVRVEPDAAIDLVEAPGDAQRELAGRIRDLPWEDAGESALAAFRETRAVPLPDPSLEMKLGLVLYDGRYYQEALEVFTKFTNATDDTLRFVALVWRGHVLDLLGRRDEALKSYGEALKVPETPSMRHDQYGLTINREWVQERLKSPFERR